MFRWALQICVVVVALLVSGSAGSASEKTQKQLKLIVESELIMLVGEKIYAAPHKNINGVQIGQCINYHVRFILYN